MDYDLTRLGAAEFEALCRALVSHVFGPYVTTYDPSGPHGWDAAFEGSFEFPEQTSGRRWDGFGVLIAKYKSASADGRRDSSWFKAAVKTELERLLTKDQSKNDSSRSPDYILFATNVALSPAYRGGLDSIYELIGNYASSLSLKGWLIWGRDDISRYLDLFPDVRLGFVLGHDYISQLSPGRDITNLTRYKLSDLGDCPEGSAEIVAAWWRLLATHKTVTGLFHTLYLLRQRTASGTAHAQVGRLSDDVQDLLRAAIVFTSAGVDACLESLLAHQGDPQSLFVLVMRCSGGRGSPGAGRCRA